MPQGQPETSLPDAAPRRALSLGQALALSAALLVLLVIAAVSITAGRGELRRSHERAEEFLRRKADQYAALLETELQTRAGIVRVGSARRSWRDVVDNPGRPLEMIISTSATWPEFAWIGLVDENGRVLADTGNVLRGADLSQQSWFAAGRLRPHFGDMRDATALNGVLPRPDGSAPRVIDLAHPARSADGSFNGVLAAQLDAGWLDTLADIADRTRGESLDYSVAIVGRDGRTRQGIPLAAAATDAMRAALTQRSDGFLEVDSDGSPVLVAYRVLRPLREFGQTGWVAVASMPRAALETRASAGYRDIALTGLMVAALVLPLAAALAYRLARPMRQLTMQLHNVRGARRVDPQRIPLAGTAETVALGAEVRSMLVEIEEQRLQLTDSASRYRELFSTHPMPMWVFDEATLRFLEVNDAMIVKYGWSREELLQMTILDIRPVEDRAAVTRAATNSAADLNYTDGPWRHRLRSGELVDVEIARHQLKWQGRDARLVVAYDVTEKLRSQARSREYQRQLGELSRQLMAKEEAERKALGQTLHDNFAQNLAAAKLALEGLMQRIGAGPRAADLSTQLRAELSSGLAPAVELLDVSIREVRSVLSDLRPPMLTDFGLSAALGYEVDRRRDLLGGHPPHDDDGIRFLEHDMRDEPVRPDSIVEYGIFMIAREAMHNAISHAHAAHIDIELTLSSNRVRLLVRDDGVGFDAEPGYRPGHLGLIGMQERARWIDAELTIDSAPGRGTAITVDWRADVAARAWADE